MSWIGFLSLVCSIVLCCALVIMALWLILMNVVLMNQYCCLVSLCWLANAFDWDKILTLGVSFCSLFPLSLHQRIEFGLEKALLWQCCAWLSLVCDNYHLSGFAFRWLNFSVISTWFFLINGGERRDKFPWPQECEGPPLQLSTSLQPWVCNMNFCICRLITLYIVAAVPGILIVLLVIDEPVSIILLLKCCTCR